MSLTIKSIISVVAFAFAAGSGTLEPTIAPPHRSCDRDEYNAVVLRVIDGDTIEARIDLGMDTTRTTKIRLSDVDTPEVRGETRPAGIAATEFTRSWVASHDHKIVFFDRGDDKYGGRRNGIVKSPSGVSSLGAELTTAGHVKR